jgi:hypothetical protein
MYEICFIVLLITNMLISVVTTIYYTIQWFQIFYMADCCIPCTLVKLRLGWSQNDGNIIAQWIICGSQGFNTRYYDGWSMCVIFVYTRS